MTSLFTRFFHKKTQESGGYTNYDDGQVMGAPEAGLKAPGPSLVTPSNAPPDEGVIAPEQAQAAQTTTPLEVANPQVYTPASPQQTAPPDSEPLRPTQGPGAPTAPSSPGS